jgi:hypothetical protein
MPLAMCAVAGSDTENMVPEFPQQQSVRDLLKACASSSLSNLGRARRNYCAGFVSGVEEAVRLKSQLLGADSRICPSSRITSQQLADAYIKYANANPDQLDKPAVEVVFEALKQSFPCL